MVSDNNGENPSEHLLLQQMPACICTLEGKDLRFKLVNDRFAELFNLHGTEYSGKPFIKVLPGMKQQKPYKLLEKAYKTGKKVEKSEVPIRFDDDNDESITRYFNLTFIPVKNDKGKTSGLFTIGVEVTEQVEARRQAEAIKDRFEFALQASEDILYDHDMVDDAIMLSENFQQVFGYNFADEEFTLEKWASLLHPDDKDRINTRLEKVLSDKKENKWEAEFRYAKNDGTYADVRENAYIIRNSDGKPVRMVGIVKNITEQKQRELKKELSANISRIFNESDTLSGALKGTLYELKALGKFQLSELWLTDKENNRINLAAYIEKEVSEFYDFKNIINSFKKGEGLPGKTWKSGKVQFWKNVDKRKTFIRREGAAKTGLKTSYGFPILYNNKVLGALLFGLKENMEKSWPSAGILEELAEQLGEEIHRKKLEEELSRIYESAPDGILVAGFDGYFKKVNPAMCEMLGYTEEELLSTPFIEFVHPDDRHKTIEEVESIKRDKPKAYFENRYITKSGNVVWMGWTTKIFPEEKLTYSVAKDITEQKKLEELFNQTSKLAKIGSWELDMVSNKIYWTDVTREIHEAEPGFEPDLEDGINFYKEGESRKKISEAVNHAIETGEGWDLELQIVTAKGNERWVRAIGEAEMVDGECVRIYGSFQDIHENKTMQLRLKNMTDNLPGVVFQYILRPEGEDQMLYISDRADEILGFNKSKLTDNVGILWERVHEEDIDALWTSVARSAETLNRLHQTWRYHHPDGTTRWLDGLGVPHRLQDGSTVFDVIILDITEKKELEELLAQSSRMAKVGSWNVDVQSGQVYWSETSKEIFEVKNTDQLNSDKLFDIVPDDSHREMLQAAVQKAVESGESYDLEVKIISAKGNEKWIRTIGEPEFRDGDCIRVFGSVQDIHVRKVAEETLKSKSRQLDAIAQFNGQLITKEHWIQALDNSLETFGSVAKADRVYFFENSRNETTGKLEASMKLEWVAEGIAPEIRNEVHHNQPLDEFPFLVSSLKHRKAVSHIVKEIKDKKTREFLETQDIKSILIIPVFTGRSFRGYIGFDDCTHERVWSEEEIAFLQTIALNLASAIESEDAEQALEEAYEEKNEILESIGDAFFAVDNEWTVTYWNSMAEEFLGMPKEKIVGKNLWEMYEDAVELDFYSQYHKAMKYQVTVHFEEYYPATGTWFEVSAYPSATGLSVFFKDITERYKAIREISLSNERFLKVAEVSKDAIWDYNVQEESMLWGEGFYRLFGYGPEKFGNDLETWEERIHKDDRERIKNSMEEIFKNNTKLVWEGEYRFLKADGEYAYIQDRGSVIRNKEGEVVRVVGAMSDVTEQKEYVKNLRDLNESLKKQADELAASNAELEQFAFVASHDLQEPLRMITGFLAQLERKYGEHLDERAQKYIHFATDGAKRMRHIILDLLEFSRVGRVDTEREFTDLNEITEEAIDLNRQQINESGGIVQVDPLPSLHVAKVPLRQLFQNLINNGLKYYKPGNKPVVQVKAEELDEVWKFSVSDNGIGISEQYKEKIFNIFQRLHGKEEYSGTGVGLAISKKIVEEHGGEIWVESEPGKGSTFYFTISKDTA